MSGTSTLRGVPRLLTVAVTGAALAVAPWTGPAHAAAPAEYLALGDSISYGYDPNFPWPFTGKDFVGYPTDVGAARGSTAVNASCPGDTAAGFVSAQRADVGCRSYRTDKAIMHVDYEGPQLQFATAFLRSHPKTDLVTIGIGINDFYACIVRTTDRCAKELATVKAQYRVDLTTILSELRTVYDGTIVLVNYPGQYYGTSATFVPSQVNAEMAKVAPRFGAVVADTYAAFAAHTAGVNGDSCAAGLMIVGPDGCDSHLTPAGRAVVAGTISAAIDRANARPWVQGSAANRGR
ncbi:MAG: SGNH/GDSL hydrolase family protein [Sporichthyaceae bacterium]